MARQTVNLVGAVFQIETTALASVAIQDVVDGRTPLIEPALYAFSIWGVIFALSLSYAFYQTLPANRENPLLRAIGPYTAVAFFCVGLWSVFVPQLLVLPALAMLLRASSLPRAFGTRRIQSGGLLLVAPTVGIFLDWMTAANVESVDSEAIRFGLVEAGATGEAVLGSVLLLAGTVLACAVILAGRTGPAQGYLAYAATVLWVLTGTVVNQYYTSPLTTGAALLAATLVAVVLFAALHRNRDPRYVVSSGDGF